MSFDAVTFLTGLFQPNQPAPAADPLAGIESPSDLPPEWRDIYEERAAIRHFDGGQALEHAEAEAFRETLAAMKRAIPKAGS
jgi:hypothetical protein